MFLPVIEDHSLAIDIGEWVIDTAMTQMEKWHAVGLDLPVSVNVGARQLQQANFVERLRATLARHPTIKPSCLELEILETSALEDVAGVSFAIEACRNIGVMFALDDFGTGYSSLTYLKRLSVSMLKIDQSFVRDMLTDPDDLAILEGVIGLASAFRRSVIAEGVETIEHGTMLLQLGCDWAQGYGIARPMPAEAMPNWVETWRPDATWGDVPVVSREGLPLLFACVEHRAWVASFVDFLNDKRDTPQQLDHQKCRFGHWLDNEGQALYGAHPELPEINALHQQVHTLAIELIGLDTTQPRSKALVRVNELYALRDALLEKLKLLSHK
jgi:EAL domain-containing protein (putative c-di-GMP-specific phosphodiesterase class I)